MLNTDEAKVNAWGAIAELFGLDYFKSHFKDACQAYPANQFDNVEYEYFIGFEGVDGLWTVFARVLVNRETKKVTFLDFKTPEGRRMEHPIKPISFT